MDAAKATEAICDQPHIGDLGQRCEGREWGRAPLIDPRVRIALPDDADAQSVRSEPRAPGRNALRFGGKVGHAGHEILRADAERAG